MVRRTKERKRKDLSGESDVPARLVKSKNNSLYGSNSILIQEVEDHPYMLPKDRKCMNNFEDRPYQLAAGKEIAQKFLGGDGNGAVALISPNNSGKTIEAKIAMRHFCAMAQKNNKTQGSTLIMYSKNQVDKKQATDIGAFTDIAFSSKASFKEAIREEIGKRGTATVMIADRGLSNILDTKVLLGGNVYNFRDLDAEEFGDVGKLKASFKDGKLPYLVELVKELKIRNVIIICDEFHNLMRTHNDNRLRLLANNKKMSTMSNGPCPFNMYLLGMSATPATKETVTCSTSKFYAKRKLFNTLEPLPKEYPRIDVETLDTLEKRVYVVYDDAAVIRTMQNWTGFYGSGIRNERVNRTRCIEDPSNPATLEHVAKMCAMNALIPAKKTDKGWKAVNIELECDDGKSIKYASSMPSKANPNTVYFTSKGLDVVTRSYLSDMDASLFLQGRMRDHQHINDANPISPKRVPMREVTAVNNHTGGRVTATFREKPHFHTILLAVDSAKDMKMTMSRAAAAELNEDPGYKSTVFDFVDTPAEVMNKIMRNEVEPMVKEDNTQVIILVRSLDVEGMSEFSKYVTMTVFCGYNRDRLTQSLYRMDRQPAPLLGMIVPMPDVGYIALSACSDMSSNVVADTHSCIDCVLVLPENDECRQLFLSLRETDKAASSRFARHLFVLSNDKKKCPVKVDDLCTNLCFANASGRLYTSLVEGFEDLYAHREEEKSKLWGDTFAEYLEMMLALRAETVAEDDE